MVQNHLNELSFNSDNKYLHMDFKSTERITLPHIGYGTWDIRGETGLLAIENALKIGYRLIDTASYYENEEIVGKAVNNLIEAGFLQRKEVFITTKLWPNEFANPERAIERSMASLDLDYVDLYLIHWPGNSKELRMKGYHALENTIDDGVSKHIGVSNYSIEQLLELNDRVPPTVNQIHVSPFRYPRDLISYCQNEEIVVQAYTPVEYGKKSDNFTLQRISKKHGKTPEQIMLRWSIQKGMVPIPRSSNPEHQRINFEIFDFMLSEDDIKQLDTLP